VKATAGSAEDPVPDAPTSEAPPPRRAGVKSYLLLVVLGYLFFLAIEFVSSGMKTSFADMLQAFLAANAAEFTELRSFVIGVVGTAFVQSSSTVTSMSVVLAQEGVMPLLIAAGIVHGANLGTSVTSSIVAFATDAPKATGNLLRDARNLLFKPRGEGFHRAVGAAVVHDFFNIIMITAILLFLELPFGWILHLSEGLATWLEGRIASSEWVLTVTSVVSPGTYTKPVAKSIVHGIEWIGGQAGAELPPWVPGTVLVVLGLPLLFWSLKTFSQTMKGVVLSGVDTSDVSTLGDKLLGTNRYDTFVRGMVLTMLVQSSSATTSMVVPLAAMGFFRVRRIFPFILGANVGTTFTALLAATGGLGAPGFHEGMTIALCHLMLNTFAVVLAWVVIGLPTSILGSADFLAEKAEKTPAVLLLYLAGLVIALPLVVYLFPQTVAAALMSIVMLFMLVGPHVYVRTKLQRQILALAEQAGVVPHPHAELAPEPVPVESDETGDDATDELDEGDLGGGV